jgi:RND superfamily putative drug exporter
MGRDYLWGVALATSLAVTAVVLASVTLLPALLGFAGRTIDRFRLPWFRHDVDGRRTLSWRWSRVMQRRPLVAGLAALVVLLVLAAPATDMRFGMPDAGNGPTELTSKRAYDLVAESYGLGANGPLLVAVDLADARPRRPAIAADLADTPGVAAVVPPANEAGDVAVISVIPTTGPQDEATEDLVHTLRDTTPPRSRPPEPPRRSGSPRFIDDSEQTASRLPCSSRVVVLPFLLLMSVFRSFPSP